MNIKNILFSVIITSSMFNGIEISAFNYEKMYEKARQKARKERALYGEGRVSLRRKQGGNIFHLTSYGPSDEDGSCGAYDRTTYIIPAKSPIIIKQSFLELLSRTTINTAEDTFNNLEDNGEKFSHRYVSPRGSWGETTSLKSCKGFSLIIVGNRENHQSDCKEFEEIFKDFQENQKTIAMNKKAL